MLSNERLNELSIGYDLDGGGHAFETTDHIDLQGCAVLDSGIDYVLGERCPDALFLAFDPRSMLGAPNSHPWPVLSAADGLYVPRTSGMLYASDHDCNCHGRESEIDPEDVSSIAIMPKPEWICTGDARDQPNPECERCDGTGYVDSAGGTYALYHFVAIDFDALCAAVEAQAFLRAAERHALTYADVEIARHNFDPQAEENVSAAFVFTNDGTELIAVHADQGPMCNDDLDVVIY